MELTEQERRILNSATAHVDPRTGRRRRTWAIVCLVMGLAGCAILLLASLPDLFQEGQQSKDAWKSIGFVLVLTGGFFGAWEYSRFQSHAYSLIRKLAPSTDPPQEEGAS